MRTEGLAEGGGPGLWPEMPARVAALVEVARGFSAEEEHAAQVTRLAGALFDQLREYHGLGGGSRELLLAAGVLHDVGLQVAVAKHNKHSRRLIEQTRLPGFSARERRIVALLSRYHRGRGPLAKHRRFAELSAADQERVRALAAILRVADGLDRTHTHVVAGADIKAEGDGFRLRVRALGDARWEILAAQKKADVFQEVFGPLRIEMAPA